MDHHCLSSGYKEEINNLGSHLKNQLKNVFHSNFCGICLAASEGTSMVNFDNINLQSIHFYTVEQMMSDLFGETINADIPSLRICQTCKSDLIQAHKFVNKVKNTTHLLHSYVDQVNYQIDALNDMILETKDLKFDNAVIVLQNILNITEAATTENLILIPKCEPKTNCYNRLAIESLDNAQKANSNKVKSDKNNTFKFVCEYCHDVFRSKQFIAKHIKRKHGSELMLKKKQQKNRCPECRICRCVHEKYLQAFNSQNESKSLIKCVECDYMCTTKSSLIAHANVNHLKIYPYLCEICGQTFHSKKTHYDHMKQCHKVSCICIYCDHDFKNESKLKSHLDSCKTMQRIHKCDECPASFDQTIELVSHKTKHDAYSCSFCYKKCTNLYRLNKHIVTHLGNKKLNKPRPCSICDAVLHSVTELRLHLKNHKPDEKHKCHTCKKQFNSRRDYNTHVNTPSHLLKVNPNKKFNIKCTECTYTSTNNQAMENHRNALHLKVKPYECNLCSKAFTTPVNLKKHSERHEGVKQFQCSVCSSLFTSGGGLKKHMLRQHSEKRPYACNMCDRTFVSQSECSLHKLRNHSEKSVLCPLCSAKFHSIANVRVHIKSVHFKNKSLEEVIRTEDVSKEFCEMFRDHRLKL